MPIRECLQLIQGSVGTNPHLVDVIIPPYMHLGALESVGSQRVPGVMPNHIPIEPQPDFFIGVLCRRIELPDRGNISQYVFNFFNNCTSSVWRATSPQTHFPPAKTRRCLPLLVICV
jgi:hypothetical protein